MLKTSTPPLLADRIKAQRAAVVRAQHEADELVRTATRELASLIDQAVSGEGALSYSQAAECVGVKKAYAHALVKRLRAGELDRAEG